MTRAPSSGQLLVPEPERLDRRLLGADGAQQGVALREDPRHLDEVAGRAPIALGQDAVQEAAPIGRRADQQQHLLRPEQDDARHVGQRRGAARHAVDVSRLRIPGRRRLRAATSSTLRRRRRAAGQVQAHTGERRAVADELDLDRGAV